MSSDARPHIDIAARCACGAIGLAVSGQVVSMLLCACLDCQRATGSGHSTVALVPNAALTVTGTPKSVSRTADSGATFTRHFCGVCGTPLYGQSSRAPDLRMLAVGFFAGQTDWFAPRQLIFARSQQAWDLVGDHIARHQRYRDSTP
ncbi:GFA family protein [Devosia sp. FKR38]|uniref:GFA family protein n=1 Tax=Devosia sp. FKR38 TaxID=2562312 RepID=UPI0010C0AD00|nr:GFA family protein [Devosia sp. FKR38]